MSKEGKSRIPRTRGRRTKLTAAVQQAIVNQVINGNYLKVAAAYAGIDESTFYNWMRRGEEEGKGDYFDFFQSVRQAEARLEVRNVTIITEHIVDNHDPDAAMSFLERRFRERWGRSEKLPEQMEPPDLSLLNDEQLANYLELLSYGYAPHQAHRSALKGNRAGNGKGTRGPGAA